MAITVTEDPFKYRLSLRLPWKAYREFIVTGTGNASAALAAIDATNPSTRVPQADDEHPANSRLVCVGPEVRDRKSIEYWVIGCEYEIPLAGTATLGDPDPLREKPFVDWNPLLTTEPVDVDLDDRPIVNMAGDRIDGASRTVRGFAFTVTRNEPFFDIIKSEQWSLTVCNTTVNLGGVIFPAHTLALMSIYPTGRYQFGAKYVNIGYYFERLPLINKRPFQHRFLNIGDQGWYQGGSGASKGKFTNDRDEVITGVRLGMTGKPIAPSGEIVKVASNTPIDNPSLTELLDFDELPDNGGYALYYKRLREADLSPILFNDV